MIARSHPPPDEWPRLYAALLKDCRTPLSQELLGRTADLGRALGRARLPLEEVVVVHNATLADLIRAGATSAGELLESTTAVVGLFAAAYSAAREELAAETADALRESEERFRTFFDNLGDAAYRADTHGNITYANKFSEELTGSPAEDLIGKSFLPLFEPDSQRVAIDVYQRTLDGESPEYELTFLNGRTSLFKNEPWRDKDGKIIGVFGIARDITARKQTEEALRESEQRYRTLFDDVPVGLYRTTPDGQLLDVNARAGRDVRLPGPPIAHGLQGN